MSRSNGVLAVIVTYNPEHDIIDNIIALKDQVQKILIVDNHSENDVDFLRTFCNSNNIEFIQNENNLGIATALNIGVDKLKDNYKYFLTMDQDSRMESDCVERLVSALKSNAYLGAVGANYGNFVSKEQLIEKDLLITSGCLARKEVVVEIGGFVDELFIDCVDFDFSLAVKTLGYRLAIVPQALMEHHLGEKKGRRFLGIKFSITEHSAARYYYIYRNHKYIIAKYRRLFPKICLKKSIMQILHTIEVLLFHDNRKEKVKQMRAGKKDSKLFIRKLLKGENIYK